MITISFLYCPSDEAATGEQDSFMDISMHMELHSKKLVKENDLGI